jgi:D-methionine transport system substrate-binding protein
MHPSTHSFNNRSRPQYASYLSRGIAFSAALCLLLVAGCRSHAAHSIRVGVTPGPAEDILHAIEPDLAARGVELKVIRFSDYIQPNMALASHDIDVNLYQNVPFLTQFNHDHQTSFVSLARIYVPLMAIYPGHAKTLAAIPTRGRIAIPNDPVNHDRALQLLEKAGLLTLSHDGASSAARIQHNPRQLQLLELDAAQLPRSLDDVDAAVINANFALDAGLNPRTGSLFSETQDSLYANILASNLEQQSAPQTQALSAALTSARARDFIAAHYNGAVFPAS